MDFKSHIEQFVRMSGQPVSARDVQEGLEKQGVDLTQYVESGSSILATIQWHLEALASEKRVTVTKLGDGTRFQWIYRSNPAPSSLASKL
jgi:hypothetical protein